MQQGTCGQGLLQVGPSTNAAAACPFPPSCTVLCLLQEMLGIPLLGAIPEDQQVIVSTNRGEPLVLQKKLSLSGIAFENAARRLIGKQDYFVDVQVSSLSSSQGVMGAPQRKTLMRSWGPSTVEHIPLTL